jgi:hypothetical protein
VLTQIVGAIVDHGEAEVAAALSRAMSQERCDLLGLAVEASRPAQSITVPPALAAHAVESGRAADYDWLLQQGGRS